MDFYLALFFALPIVGLLSAVYLVAKNPPQPYTHGHPNAPHPPAAHR